LTLEQYCEENIFKPLGMKNTSYRLLDHPHIAANLLKMTSRKIDGTLEQADSFYPVNPDVDMGGSNLYTSAPDFLELLKSLLCNDGRVLRPETADAMFGYRLPDSPVFAKFGKENAKYHLGQLAPNGATVGHCLAGLINNEDLIGGRKAESITWSGATRCYW
jgi:CubicO group peptidase (beta-lactamase class C family)